MAIYQLGDSIPEIHPTAYVSPEATVIGKVKLRAGVSVWPAAVIRGDTESITIGEGSNIQDGAVLHADPGCPLNIGKQATVGHLAMLHGCTVGEGSLVGIQAVVLNNAVIGKNCLVAAGALILEGKIFPEGSLIVGSPAKVLRPLAPEEISGLKHNAEHYASHQAKFKEKLRRLD